MRIPGEGAAPAGVVIELAEAEPEAAVQEAGPEAAQETEPSAGLELSELLPDPAALERAERAVAVGMGTARVVSVTGRQAMITRRGRDEPTLAVIAPEVDPLVIGDARDSGDAVLVELAPGEAPVVVGVLKTQRPREIRLKAATVVIEGEEEVLLRSGRGAVRIRADGDIEVVGSRISAASRGLFRIVGRMLRLN